MLDIELFDISVLNGNKVCLHLKRLDFSSSSTFSRNHPANYIYPPVEYFVKMLEDKLKNSLCSKYKEKKKIFISREGSKTRKVVNYLELKNLLNKYQIDEIKLEECSITEQIELFHNADLIIGVHGAGLANIMFCKNNSNVIEILPAKCATPAFWMMSHSKLINYNVSIGFLDSVKENSCIDYNNWEHRPDLYNKDDIYIDCIDLEAKINGMIK